MAQHTKAAPQRKWYDSPQSSQGRPLRYFTFLFRYNQIMLKHYDNYGRTKGENMTDARYLALPLMVPDTDLDNSVPDVPIEDWGDFVAKRFSKAAEQALKQIHRRRS